MRSIARMFLSIDQRLYDILGITLIGTAGNVIVGCAGRDDEYELIRFGLACILSGGVIFFLRSKRSAIENSADANRLLNKQAVATKAALLASRNSVPKDVEERASAAANGRKKDLRDEIDVALAMKSDVVLVMLAVIASTTLAFIGIKGIVSRLYIPANHNIEDTFVNATTANHKEILCEIRNLHEKMNVLSSALCSNDTRVAAGVTRGSHENALKINSLRGDHAALSTSPSNETREVKLQALHPNGLENAGGATQK